MTNKPNKLNSLDGQELLIWPSTKKRIHLGDAFAAVSSGIYVAKMRNLNSIKLSIPYVHYRRGNLKFMKEVLNYFDLGGLEVEIVPFTEVPIASFPEAEAAGIRTVVQELRSMGIPPLIPDPRDPSKLIQGKTSSYDAPYCKLKITRAAEIQRKICYSWDAIYRKKEIPSNIELLTEALAEEFSGYELVQLGLPKTIEEDLRALSDCFFFIGFDSGMAHLCRFIGAPLVLLGNIGAFSEHACERKVLEWKNVNDVWVNRTELFTELREYLHKSYSNRDEILL